MSAATTLESGSRAAARSMPAWMGPVRRELGGGGLVMLGVAAIGFGGLLAGGEGSVRDATFLFVNGASAVAILVGIRVGRPAARAGWLALATAMGAYTVGDVLQVFGPVLRDPVLADAGQGVYVLAYPLFFVAAIRFVGGARRLDPVAIIDSAIVGLATGLLVWEILVEPNLPAVVTVDAALMAAGYPVVATLLVTLVLPLVLMHQTRSLSAVLLVLGLALVGVADTIFALGILRAPAPSELASNAGWLAGYVCLGLAGIVPSSVRLGGLAERTVRRDALRFVLLSLALFVPPVLIILEASTAPIAEIEVYAVVAVLLVGLLVLRLQRTVAAFVASDERFRRFMSYDSLIAMIKDGHGRYTFMNQAAERSGHVAPGSWYGKRDEELYPMAAAARYLRGDARVREHDEPDVETYEDNGRTWLVERFPMPGNHGAIGVLGMDVTGRVEAEQRLHVAEQLTDRWTRERALIAETLAALDAGRTPEETADAICSRIVRLPGVAIASIVTFGPDGIAAMLGQVVVGASAQPGLRLAPARSAYLFERANGGPWVERWVSPPNHPYKAMLERAGVRAHAFAPITNGGEVGGVLIVGSSAPDSIDHLTERLPAIAEFGQITSALLGPQLAGRLAIAKVESQVREIIDTEAFDIAYQPIVELGTGYTGGYEALSRFRDGIAPDAHFRQAHEIGLGIELELACVRAALRGAVRLDAGAWLNVNVSPDVVLTGSLERLLPLRDRVVVLEITEHEAITDYAAFRQAVARLDGAVHIAVDDAGAGFASLRHIVELDPLFVKIDRSLVAGIATDAARQAVVAGMVRFAETAHLTLIAEGIETPEELAALKAAGVALGQGYLLGRPEIPTPRPT